ncbi:site-specific tyrosine recombinase XerD [Streptococcus salivarius]|uniref:Tyrosine recombinase XerD-like n=1 Tax=Streptococcus salivarius TaxID=1304 RepID=A0A074JHK6_STRSL|nr:site-specific tyrosine recombinase XerD [Streptococcus salivarius]KEO45534.1 recombinase XerD [Streptococcus salivarius]KEO46901.1 recombinase XerD [Streptococcus salivarius]
MTISSFQKQLTTQITDFLSTKVISESSKQAYAYDLKQFTTLISGQIDQTTLKLYENQLKEWKPSVQKRKRSAVNQFLLYLYQKGELAKFFKLSEMVTLPSQEDKLQILDLSSLYEGREGAGKLACLLILELGLLPSEILELNWSDIDLDFGVLTVAKGTTKRVLRLEADLKQYLLAIKDVNSQGLLLGKVYTRQWLYKQIQTYVSGRGLSNVTAQVLRQQFILRQIEKGTGAFELARLLGLKSPVTLEKYYKI